MANWDIDRYEQLQDSAWEIELLANERHDTVDPKSHARSSAVSRDRAGTLRQEAADLLAQYWVKRRST
jgi:hypothetical protein